MPLALFLLLDTGGSSHDVRRWTRAGEWAEVGSILWRKVGEVGSSIASLQIPGLVPCRSQHRQIWCNFIFTAGGTARWLCGLLRGCLQLGFEMFGIGTYHFVTVARADTATAACLPAGRECHRHVLGGTPTSSSDWVCTDLSWKSRECRMLGIGLQQGSCRQFFQIWLGAEAFPSPEKEKIPSAACPVLWHSDSPGTPGSSDSRSRTFGKVHRFCQVTASWLALQDAHPNHPGLWYWNTLEKRSAGGCNQVKHGCFSHIKVPHMVYDFQFSWALCCRRSAESLLAVGAV